MRNKNSHDVDSLDPMESMDDSYPLVQDDEITELFFGDTRRGYAPLLDLEGQDD